MESIEYRPIGILHSPFKTPKGSPIQPTAAKGIEGKIEIFAEFSDGLQDLAGFSHIFVIQINSAGSKIKPERSKKWSMMEGLIVIN